MSFTWFHTLAFVRPKVLQALQRRGKVHKNSEHILFAKVSMLHHREANGHGLVWMQLCSVSALLNLKFCIEQAREILCQSHPADQISTIAEQAKIALLALKVAYWGLTDWHHLTSIATFRFRVMEIRSSRSIPVLSSSRFAQDLHFGWHGPGCCECLPCTPERDLSTNVVT